MQTEDLHVDFVGGPTIFIGIFEVHRNLTGATALTCLCLDPPLATLEHLGSMMPNTPNHL